MQFGRILLIEDEDQHIKLFRRHIQRARPDVALEVAEDGATALAWLQAQPQLDDLLVLLDLNLPVMDGIELLAALRGDPRFADLRIIVLTTSDMGQDIQRARDLRVAEYWIKPISYDQLRAIIR